MGAYGSPELSVNSSVRQNINKYTRYCHRCGNKLNITQKRCPYCHTKQLDIFYNKWWFWILVAFIGFCLICTIPNYNRTINTATQNEQETIISEEEFKNSCTTFDYNELERNPNEYINKNAVFTGKVVQVMEYGNDISYRVNITKDNYGLWVNTIYVDYTKKDENERRILEGDIITIYGTLNGIKHYTSIQDAQVSIPHLIAKYVETNQ